MGYLLPQNWSALTLAEIARLTPVERLIWPSIEAYGIEVYVKREDRLDPYLAGNKFYKLFGYWHEFQRSDQAGLASFGGAYSNHLYALAAFGKAQKVPTLAVVRGERPAQLSSTLADIQALGTQLHFVPRSEYRLRDDPRWLAQLQRQFSEFYFIPEGGAGYLGSLGCQQWGGQAISQCPSPPDRICVAAGTGCTAAGIAAAAGETPVHVYLALKGRAEQLQAFKKNICDLRGMLDSTTSNKLPVAPNISLETNYHCEGYAKFPAELRSFVERFERETGLPLDPVYTAKMFWGIWCMAQQQTWPKGSTILAFHTGGLQGRRGFHLL